MIDLENLADYSPKDGKLHPEVKELWLEALRSGEYEQARETIRTATGWCCLGVLCEAIGYEVVIAELQAGYRVADTLIPVDWMVFSGLNDIKEMTFPEIANVIEEQY